MTEREYKTSEAQRKAAAKYKKANIKNYNFQVNRTTEKDLLDHMERQTNKSDYIKSLVRLDMEKGPGLTQNKK